MADGISFRRARPEDLPQLIALIVEGSMDRREDAGNLAAYERAFAAIDSDPNQLLGVAELDGNLIGCLQVSFIPGLSRQGAWRGHIEAVRIAEPHRNRGHGRKMMAWAIGQCYKRGCVLVQLTSDKRRSAAHRFYDRLGFEASHVGFKLRRQSDPV